MKEIQIKIIKVINERAKINKEPIPLIDIINLIPEYKPRTLRASAETLVRKGYLRRSCAQRGAVYILIRTI